MTIVDCCSDLHGHFPKLDGGDLLIIAGDLTKTDRKDEYEAFDAWLRDQQYRKKVVIAGNHDNHLQNGYKIKYGEYLEDSGIEFDGFKIWGSPWTARFHGMNPHCMAFTLENDNQLKEKWDLIPKTTDILVTHCPPFGTMDEVYDGLTGQIFHAGSTSLEMAVDFCPKLFVYGHVHEEYGAWERKHFKDKKTLFVNASYVDKFYQPINPPIRILL